MKKDYKLKLKEDFKPFVGLADYHVRSADNLVIEEGISNDQLNYFAREFLLVIYNGIIAGTTGQLIVEGLGKLLT